MDTTTRTDAGREDRPAGNTRAHRGTGSLRDQPLPPRGVLAVGWASFVLLYAYVDILGFYLPGTVEDILDGVVWEFAITQTWAVGSLAFVAVPIVMILGSALLPARPARSATLVVGGLYVPVTVGNAIGEAWLGYYGLAVALELAVLAVLLHTAWTWPRAAADAS